MDKISTIVDEKGNIVDDEIKKNEVNEYILNSLNLILNVKTYTL